MNKPKTTEELKALLDAQRKAVMNGAKVMLGDGNPGLRAIVKQTLDKEASSDPLYRLFGLEGLETIWAYQDYRTLIQQYQVENQISAIEWQSIKMGDRLISFPDINDQLVCLESDLEVLRNYKTLVVAAWAEHTKNKNLMFWYEDSYRNYSSFYCDVTRDEVLNLANNCEWAMLYDWKEEPEEVTLQVGWGDPLEADYFCYPDSDSFYFHSAPRDLQMKALEEVNQAGWQYEYCWACPVKI
jgi:hypothetical protein